MPTSLLLLLVLATPARAPAAPPPDSATAHAAVMEVLDRFRPRQGGTVLQLLAVDQFADFLARDARAAWTERLWEPEVRLDGTLAAVWAEYDFHFGTEFSHCGTDAFQLLETADGWKVVALADTYRREGCPVRPPPE